MMGRPTHKPTVATRKTVMVARGCKVNMEDIAAMLGINTDTLNKYYKHELANGKTIFKVKVGKALLNEINKGNSTLIKYYMNNEMNFSEKASIDVNNTHSLEITPIPAFNRILADIATKKEAIDSEVTSEDRPVLPAPVCTEPT